MKYRVVFETTATHDIEVELDDDFFDAKKDDKGQSYDVPECDGSCNLQEIQECQTVYITNDKGEEVWTI
jgi:hypothetical protein